MIQILGLFTFIFGAIIGSFLNVVALRYKTGRGVNGRSFCFSCGKTLHPLELIPIISFLALRGRCHSCKTPLSWQYPLVELITASTFFLIFERAVAYGGTVSYLSIPVLWIASSVLIVIAIYDAKHKIVPDMLAFVFGAISLAWLLFSHDIHYFSTTRGLFDLFSGPLFFLPFFFLWLVSSGRWMGLGDGKLVVGFGWLFGFAIGASGIILGFWIAAAVSLLILINGKLASNRFSHLTLKSEVSFAPFLILGVLLAYYFSMDLLSFNTLVNLF